jgi:hypothetical protein
MLDLPGKSAPERAAIYRQLATKLREVAVDDEQLRRDFLELARQYDARAANIWPSETDWPSSSRSSPGAVPHRRLW